MIFCTSEVYVQEAVYSTVCLYKAVGLTDSIQFHFLSHIYNKFLFC